MSWPSIPRERGRNDMPGNRFNGFTDYGIGFRLRAPHYDHIALLSALRRGKTIEHAIESAFRKSSVAPASRAAFVQYSFQTWAALGWFCRPEANVHDKKVREERA
jgi:hypothetical protein